MAPARPSRWPPAIPMIETPDVQHFGANEGTTPVEIYAASLLSDGEPVAIPLPTGAPSRSP